MLDKEPILNPPKQPKGFWGRLFCWHIWKETGREHLRDTHEPSAVFFEDYRYIAVHYECIKCGKTCTIEKRLVII